MRERSPVVPIALKIGMPPLAHAMCVWLTYRQEDLARIESEFMDNTKPEAGEEDGGYENDAADVAADAAAPAEEEQ